MIRYDLDPDHARDPRLGDSVILRPKETACLNCGHVEATTVCRFCKVDKRLTVTGRLGSNDPNLQNIPMRTAEGRLIREAFIASLEGLRPLPAQWMAQANRACSHAWQDKEVRERNLMVGVLTVSPYWDPATPDSELAGTRNMMYTGRTYICINCGLELAVPGAPRRSRFISYHDMEADNGAQTTG